MAARVGQACTQAGPAGRYMSHPACFSDRALRIARGYRARRRTLAEQQPAPRLGASGVCTPIWIRRADNTARRSRSRCRCSGCRPGRWVQNLMRVPWRQSFMQCGCSASDGQDVGTCGYVEGRSQLHDRNETLPCVRAQAFSQRIGADGIQRLRRSATRRSPSPRPSPSGSACARLLGISVPSTGAARSGRGSGSRTPSCIAGFFASRSMKSLGVDADRLGLDRRNRGLRTLGAGNHIQLAEMLTGGRGTAGRCRDRRPWPT